MSIRLYNTLTKRKEQLQTVEPGKVRFYACGPTVYDRFHIGNARMFVVFDTVRRYLSYRGYEVQYVQNFTDVDDKIIQRAIESGDGVREVANRNIEEYFRDAAALGVMPADVHPRVTDCMADIIQFIAELVDTGHAYVVGQDVYFRTASFPDYGKLSGQSLAELRAGFRIDVNEEKLDPTDFTLWKAAKPGEESWESRWGPGRPGWHIECSVMNRKYLGEHIDIHGGGRDLMFPHHENEIAQSEARFGEPFARYWMHNGMIQIDGEKMSKSLGNFVTARDLLHLHAGRTLRIYLLSAHYRRPLNYTADAMVQAQEAVDRIWRCLQSLDHRQQYLQRGRDFVAPDGVPDTETAAATAALQTSVRRAFELAMDDDFNTADAIAAVFEGVRAVNTWLQGGSVTAAGVASWRALLLALLAVLGLTDAAGAVAAATLSEAEVSRLVRERTMARQERAFERADQIRSQLEQAGIVLEDTPQGPRWRQA